MILIAESGSSKTHWCALDSQSGELKLDIISKGLNPVLFSQNYIAKEIQSNIELLACSDKVEILYFYGAGCGEEREKFVMASLLQSFFPLAKTIDVQDDMMAAVHACTDRPGVVAILGTGSNCCFYDGEKIHSRLPSLGYILMDEGSGNHLGRLLLRAYYFKELNEPMRSALESSHDVSPETVKTKLYKEEGPAAYLATLAKFVVENKDDSGIAKLIEKSFSAFIHLHLRHFIEELSLYPIHIVGSIGFHLQEEWLRQAGKQGLIIGNIVKNPMENLILKKWKTLKSK